MPGTSCCQIAAWTNLVILSIYRKNKAILPLRKTFDILAHALQYLSSMNKSIKNLLSKITRFHKEPEAATAVEYAIMLALIVAVAFVAIVSVGAEAEGFWNNNSTELDSALN